MDHVGLQIGAFRLSRPIGRGGMATVWAGEHRNGTPVAVKIIAPRPGPSDFARLFENEVRAVAALRHPNIVVVHDYGVVEERRPQVAAGSPYLVMELVRGGSLHGMRRTMAWDELRDILRALLHALAHAHARGVVHRDIKAANVLIDRSGGRVVLTDFGLAHLGDDASWVSQEDLTRSGTPSHMAPEQFVGAWRDFGPWTDLYGLGALAWGVVTGNPPFGRGRGWHDAARLHREAPLPPLQPRIEVPAGLERWLHRLLAKDPGARFGRAADAVHELDHLDDPAPWPQSPTSADPRSAIACPGPPPRPVVLDEGWQGPAAAGGGAPTLTGVGLGLFGLRPIPMVDREQPRDALWTAARRVVEDGSPRAVVLRGPAGCGKSRLARWIAQRLDAEGAAIVVRAVHGPTGGALDGVGPMVSRWLRDEGLPAVRRQTRAAQVLGRLGATDPDEWQALLGVARPHDPTVSVRFGSARERHQAVRRWLARLADTGRMVLMWLDDVQWGLDALQLVSHVLSAPSLRVLVVMTAREEALSHQPAGASLLTALEEEDRVMSVTVGPLAEADRARLVQRLLGLEGALAKQVERRTAGNPLFAVQLVGDWVHRGLLEPTPRGFRLRPGAEATVPDDVHNVWATQLQRLLEGRVDDDLAALELAALLGQDVWSEEWEAACAAAGVRPSKRFVSLLIRERLARADDPAVQWSFVHGMLRESLERSIREAGRWSERHRQVAAGLGEVGARAARVGQHLVEAGAWAEALEPLAAGMLQTLRFGDRAEIERLAALQKRALDALGAPEADPRRLQTELRRSDAASVTGQIDEAKAISRRVATLAEGAGDRETFASALVAEAQGSLLRREHGAASQILLRALGIATEIGNTAIEARARTALAALAMGMARWDAAARHLERARVVYEALGDDEGVGRCATILGATRSKQGRWQEAQALYVQGIANYRKAGARLGQAVAHNGLAMSALDAGEPGSALDHMTRSIDLAEAVGSDAAITARVDLGTVLLALDRAEAARDMFEEAAVGLLRGGHAVRAAQARARMLDALTRLDDRVAIGSNLAVAESILKVDYFDRQTAEHLTRAAREADRRGWSEEAPRMWRLARHQWAGLERPEQVAECDEALR